MGGIAEALDSVTSLLDRLPIGVQFIDNAMRYRYLNQVAAEHGKRPREHLLGRTMQECYPGIETTEAFRNIQRALTAGEPCEMENAFVFPDGSQGCFELRMFKVFDGVVISSVDVTLRKQLEVHHRHAQRMDATRQLAGGIAHDFNNLLTIIGAYTDLVLRGSELTNGQRGDLEEVLRASNRASELTSRLLALSRQSQGEPVPLAFEPFLRGLTRTLAPMLGQAVSLQLKISGDLGVVHVDPTAIEHVVVSLALNAKDAMNGQGRVRLEARRLGEQLHGAGPGTEGAYCELAITDDGPGIPPGVLDRIFDPKLDGAQRVGTGLGLAMCWSIVERAGGTIHVESQIGLGSTFRVVLPTVARAGVEPRDVRSPRPMRSAGGCARILVVDDELAIRQLMVRQLERAGHVAVEAADGAEALERLMGAEEFDLVVSDVLMPVMGGFELARQLEQLQNPIPVLLISGYSPDDASLRLQKRWPLLCKPFTSEELVAAVDGLLRSPSVQGPDVP